MHRFPSLVFRQDGELAWGPACLLGTWMHAWFSRPGPPVHVPAWDLTAAPTQDPSTCVIFQANTVGQPGICLPAHQRTQTYTWIFKLHPPAHHTSMVTWGLLAPQPITSQGPKHVREFSGSRSQQKPLPQCIMYFLAFFLVSWGLLSFDQASRVLR